MPPITMPAGHYFTVAHAIRSGQGGQTRAVLMRNRLFLEQAGIEPTILTFDSDPVYAEERRKLTEQGLLVDGVRLLNLYEFWRSEDVSTLPVLDDASVPDFDTSLVTSRPEHHPDGTIYRTTLRRGDTAIAEDFHRPDGSRYLRVLEAEGPGPGITLFNQQGHPVQRFATKGDFFRHWIEWLAPAGRVYVISDHRYVFVQLLPMDSDRLHLIHLMHNMHLKTPGHWNSGVANAYPTLFKNLAHVDGLVCLTHRQLDDVAMRLGKTNNLYVIPNPVEMPVQPPVAPKRARSKFVMLCRLEYQKRVEDAVDIFARVLKVVPDATLEIFGSGSQAERINGLIKQYGIEHAVVLRGHDPQARQALWNTTGFLMTSRFEGYPLSTLESMSHGCPVVSYDMKYGPREQVTDGVDGFVVPAGDKEAFAERIVRLAQDPELVEILSRNAVAKARHHSPHAYLKDWQRVLTSITDNKATRVQVTSVKLVVHEPSEVPRRAGTLMPSARQRSIAPRPFKISGTLNVKGRGEARTLDQAQIRIDATCEGRPETASVPVSVERKDKTFQFTAIADPEAIFNEMGAATHRAKLRLTFTWQNFSWRAVVTRAARTLGSYDVFFDEAGVLWLEHYPDPAPPATPQLRSRAASATGRVQRLAARSARLVLGAKRWRRLRRALARR